MSHRPCLPWNCLPMQPPDQPDSYDSSPVTRMVFCHFNVRDDKAYMAIEGQELPPIGIANDVKQALKTFTRGYGMVIIKGKTLEDTEVIGYFPFPNPTQMDSDILHQQTLAFYTRRSLEQPLEGVCSEQPVESV